MNSKMAKITEDKINFDLKFLQILNNWGCPAGVYIDFTVKIRIKTWF